MNINRLSNTGTTPLPQNRPTSKPFGKKDPNSQSGPEFRENYLANEFTDLKEEEYIELVKERDILAEEIIFVRSGSQYTSHCYDLLLKYEKYSEEFFEGLETRQKSTLKAVSSMQEGIFEEMEVRRV